MGGTLPRGFFEDLYIKSPDPFDFETSAYEAATRPRRSARAIPDRLAGAEWRSSLDLGCPKGPSGRHDAFPNSIRHELRKSSIRFVRQ